MSDRPIDPETYRRMIVALEGVAEWYAEEQSAVTDEDLFAVGRDLFHVMRPVLAVLQRAKGLSPLSPCTDCGVEEGGAESGPDPSLPDGRYSICGACSEQRHPDWFRPPTEEQLAAEEQEQAAAEDAHFEEQALRTQQLETQQEQTPLVISITSARLRQVPTGEV